MWQLGFPRKESVVTDMGYKTSQSLLHTPMSQVLNYSKLTVLKANADLFLVSP